MLALLAVVYLGQWAAEALLAIKALSFLLHLPR